MTTVPKAYAVGYYVVLSLAMVALTIAFPSVGEITNMSVLITVALTLVAISCALAGRHAEGYSNHE